MTTIPPAGHTRPDATSGRLPWSWGATPAERAEPYPCEGLLPGPTASMFRAADIGAPPDVVYRWLCQLKVAPYSYDWLDNRGRRSPRALTPGLDNVAVGQRLIIFTVVEFEPGRHITAVGLPAATR